MLYISPNTLYTVYIYIYYIYTYMYIIGIEGSMDSVMGLSVPLLLSGLETLY